MFCPSCGEFISTDNPRTCPFCKIDIEHYQFPSSRTWGIPSKSASPFAPHPEVPPAGAQVSDLRGLQFKRPTGFGDGGPRRYIEKRLPKCPFCRTSEPLWEYAVVKGWLNRANFRCQKCRGVLSVPNENVTAWNPVSMLGGLGLSEYMRVEWVGDSPGAGLTGARLNGGEFPLERLRSWAERNGEGFPVSAS